MNDSDVRELVRKLRDARHESDHLRDVIARAVTCSRQAHLKQGQRVDMMVKTLMTALRSTRQVRP